MIPQTVADLTDAPYNPREIGEESLKALGALMTAFGDISGFVYNTRSAHLVCGHQRKSQLAPTAPILYDGDAKDALGTVGYGHVDGNGHRWPVRFVDWDDATEKAANVAANSPLLAGEWTPALGPILDSLETSLPELTVALRLGDLIPLRHEDIPDDNKGIDEDALAETSNRCPKCGFEW